MCRAIISFTVLSQVGAAILRLINFISQLKIGWMRPKFTNCYHSYSLSLLNISKLMKTFR